MQVTTHQAGLGTPSARLALAQRIALAALPIPPWLSDVPVVLAIMMLLVIIIGLMHRIGMNCGMVGEA